MSRVARATIHADALRHNLAMVREFAPDTRVMAVLKANGYGHGLTQVAAVLTGADAFAVSCLAEALTLREAGHRGRLVLLEGFFDVAEVAVFAQERLEAVIHSPWQVTCLEQVTLVQPIVVWLKVDSGMHRLGFRPDEAAMAYSRLQACPGVAGVNWLTHLAYADDRYDPITPAQIETFNYARGEHAGEASIANSAGTLGWPATHVDWVRPGVCLYGVSPFSDGGGRPPLQAAMTLEARLIAIYQHARGDRIGYGGTFICPADMPVGVVSIGYGDGYPRHAPNGTPVLVRGQYTGIVGRVSMDMLCVDLSGVPDAAVGDRVILWGASLPVEQIAERCGTIGYELICQLTSRVQFVYQT